MSRALAEGDVVVITTPNPLYSGVVARVVHVGRAFDVGRDRQCVEVAIPGALVGLRGLPETWEWLRPSQLTLVEDLDREGGCEG